MGSETPCAVVAKDTGLDECVIPEGGVWVARNVEVGEGGGV